MTYNTFTKTAYIERFNEIAPYVGNTPLYEITHLNPNPRVKVFAKLEWQQLGGSVKARPAYQMMLDAIHSKQLHPGTHLLDASSGNTGIAYAVFAAISGIPLTLVIPENASQERKHILKALGAELIYTSALESTDGAQAKARSMAETDPEKYFYIDQYNNPNNWKAHYHSTGLEIFNQTSAKISHFIAGLGTTGTFTGTARRLKELSPDTRVIALQPETALHGLEGWKHLETALTPGIFDATVADEVRHIDTMGAYEVLKDAAKHEGLLLSPSSAANLLGALRLAEELEEGIIVTVFPDDASKYSEIVNEILK